MKPTRADLARMIATVPLMRVEVLYKLKGDLAYSLWVQGKEGKRG